MEVADRWFGTLLHVWKPLLTRRILINISQITMVTVKNLVYSFKFASSKFYIDRMQLFNYEIGTKLLLKFIYFLDMCTNAYWIKFFSFISNSKTPILDYKTLNYKSEKSPVPFRRVYKCFSLNGHVLNVDCFN